MSGETSRRLHGRVDITETTTRRKVIAVARETLGVLPVLLSVAGFEGLVTEIDMRYTTLEADDRRILIPNSTIMTSPVSVFKK